MMTTDQRNDKSYRFIIKVIDNFGKFASKVPLKNRTSRPLADSFENILKTSKRKLTSIESGDLEEFVNKVFNDFPKKKINTYSHHT